MLPYVVTISFLLLLTIIKFLLKPDKQKCPRQLPSPAKLPIIGNLHQLGSLPHRSLAALSRKHGPLMLMHMGSVPNLVVSSEEMAREVLKTHDLIFSDRPTSIVGDQLFYHGKDIGFAPYGEYWRQVRKISVLQLFSTKRVESFQGVRKEEVSLMIQSISNFSGPINISEMAVSTFNNFIARVTFGKKFGVGKGSSKDFDQLIAEMAILLGTVHIGDIFPSFSWVEELTGLNARLGKNFRKWDEFFEKAIEEHLEPCRVMADGHTPDLVDILLDLEKKVEISRDGVKGILKDIFGAGTETVSTTLVWIMAELIRDQRVLNKLQKEIREVINGRDGITEDDIKQMDYLKSVVKETLRLHPPLPMLLPRLSTQDVELQGHFIPAKTRVLINAWAIGRDPKSWEAPDEFWPERFKESTSMSSGIDFKGHDFQLIPFGAGRRICPGIHYAVTALEFVLANLLHWFDWELPQAFGEVDMTETFGITARKKAPLLLIAKKHFHW